MNFDYTYIVLFGAKFFEPMIIVTNFILLLVAIYCFKNLIKFRVSYTTQMARFMIIMGISGCFGAAAHAMHYQLGKTPFDIVFFISGVLNLLAIYFCFRGSYAYYCIGRKPENKTLLMVIHVWIGILIIITLIRNDFRIVSAHAGISLIYSLVVHYLGYRKNESGAGVVVIGICISFLSIIFHALKISLHEWFNYKDIAHVIMIISLYIIYKGIEINATRMRSARMTMR